MRMTNRKSLFPKACDLIRIVMEPIKVIPLEFLCHFVSVDKCGVNSRSLRGIRPRVCLPVKPVKELIKLELVVILM